MKFARLVEFRNLITVASDHADAFWTELTPWPWETSEDNRGLDGMRRKKRNLDFKGAWGKSDESTAQECWQKETASWLILPEIAKRKFFVFWKMIFVLSWDVNRTVSSQRLEEKRTWILKHEYLQFFTTYETFWSFVKPCTKLLAEDEICNVSRGKNNSKSDFTIDKALTACITKEHNIVSKK